jgi:hypothetical protein
VRAILAIKSWAAIDSLRGRANQSEWGRCVIQEAKIQGFSLEKQTEIRTEIERLQQLGYPKEHLMLTQRGLVLYDPEAASDSVILRKCGHRKGPGPG